MVNKKVCQGCVHAHKDPFSGAFVECNARDLLGDHPTIEHYCLLLELLYNTIEALKKQEKKVDELIDEHDEGLDYTFEA